MYSSESLHSAVVEIPYTPTSFSIVYKSSTNLDTGNGQIHKKIIAPLAKEKPSVWTLVKLVLIGGVPTIFGAWLGGLVYSRTWTVLFLGMGVGAILQVVLQILGQMGRERPLSERLVHTPVVLGLLAGFAVMYVT